MPEVTDEGSGTLAEATKGFIADMGVDEPSEEITEESAETDESTELEAEQTEDLEEDFEGGDELGVNEEERNILFKLRGGLTSEGSKRRGRHEWNLRRNSPQERKGNQERRPGKGGRGKGDRTEAHKGGRKKPRTR